MKLLLLSAMFFSQSLYAECVHEFSIEGHQFQSKSQGLKNAYVKQPDGTYKSLDKVQFLDPLKTYEIQQSHPKIEYGNFDGYNRRYIEYYEYSHMQDYLKKINSDLHQLNYKYEVVGKSLLGRDLYGVKPVNFDPNKKTIVMFGRHHGDEGTANWIIEGFVNEFLMASSDFHSKYQLLLYPMINPDGAQEQERYNDNGRDLNRSWSVNLSKSYDEAKVIHKDLLPYMQYKDNIVIVLDMHGSFTKDFIYRVEEDYISTDFYEHQQSFIDYLGSLDIWQKGRYELSNGHRKMARIVMVKDYGLHALTHETPRDIKIKNSNGRSKTSLMAQGLDVFTTVQALY